MKYDCLNSLYNLNGGIITMKKVFALALAAAMALSMVACSSAPAEPEVTYKTGLGAVVEVAPTNETAEAGASAQITTTIAAVTFDSNDKIVSIDIDAAQQTAKFDLEGKLEGAVDLRTKAEKQYDYNMKAFMPTAVGEWFEQVEAFEAWATGKTLSEVVDMEFTTNGVGYPDTPADEDLKAGCTMSMTAFLEAIQKAYDNAIATTGVPAKTGLGVEISASVADEDAAAEKGASVQINTNMMAVAVDAEGVIVAAQLDVAQQKVAFDLDGVAGTTDLRTKVEKEGDYGMLPVSAIGKEYYEQSKAFTEWMAGQTVEAVVNMPTYERDASHTACPDVEDLKASVSITVGDYLTALAEAETNAK